MEIVDRSSYPEGGLSRVFGDTDRSKYCYYGDVAPDNSQTSTIGYTQAYQSAVNSYAEGWKYYQSINSNKMFADTSAFRSLYLPLTPPEEGEISNHSNRSSLGYESDRVFNEEARTQYSPPVVCSPR